MYKIYNMVIANAKQGSVEEKKHGGVKHQLMPTVKQEAFAVAMYTIGSQTYGNGTESARKAGYKGTDNYLARVASENVRKCKVITLKKQIQARIKEKIEHDQEIALEKLYTDYDYLEEAAKVGNISAIQARTAIIKELNEITGQHKQIFVDKTPQQRDLDDAQAKLADEFVAFKQRQRLNIHQERA